MKLLEIIMMNQGYGIRDKKEKMDLQELMRY